MSTGADDGVLILSIGSGRRQWLWNCIASVRRHRPDLGIHVLSDVPVDVPFTWVSALTGKASRYYKTQMHRLSPFSGVTAFLDDDIIVHRELPSFEDILAGAEIAVTPDAGRPTIGEACSRGCYWVSEAERRYMNEHYSPSLPQWSSGPLLFSKTENVTAALDEWHTEWMRFQDIDQLALARALVANPVRIQPLAVDAYNYWTSRGNRDSANPYLFHCVKKEDNDKWYHRRHAEPAAPHVLYKAFCAAVDRGQWGRGQYETVGRLIHARKPMHLLVWGCGHDSNLWRLLNRGGRTVFVETDPEWAKRARSSGCEVIDWQPPTSRGVPFAGDVPDCPAGENWDMVIIDGPPGHACNTPGRELPIRWAAKSRARVVVLHDLNRPWERWCTGRYLPPPSVCLPGNCLLGIWCDGLLAPEVTFG